MQAGVRAGHGGRRREPGQVLDLVGLVGEVDQHAAGLAFGRAMREPACEGGLLAGGEGRKDLEVVTMPDEHEAVRGHGEEQGFAAHVQTGRRVMSS